MQGQRRNSVRTRLARGSADPAFGVHTSDVIADYLQDAARSAGGHSPAVYFPTDEAQVAALLAEHDSILCSGARSSLTGGGTPHGEVVLSTERMNRILAWQDETVVLQPGVVLRDLVHEAAQRGVDYPPVPTYDGATIGGLVATNAAGAATFKYGATRDWVRRLSVVLANGEVLDLPRGAYRCDEAGRFDIELAGGGHSILTRAAITPPAVKKLSCGYFSQPGMDLIDLFIGAEGTLGIVTEIELQLLSQRRTGAVVLVFIGDDTRALALVDTLRHESLQTRAQADPHGLDVAAIEYLDTRSLMILREDGADRRLGVPLPAAAAAALLLQLEWPAGVEANRPLTRLSDVLNQHRVDATLFASFGEEHRCAALLGLREAVPEGVHRRIGELQRQVDARITKAGADVIVPPAQLAQSLAAYRRLAHEARLDVAIWGHVSDGNVHPNLLARDMAEFGRCREVLLAMGQAAIDLGGAPMAEHGIGRNPIKQELLLRLYGQAGIGSMWAIKRALDPQGKLAPGVLFPAKA